MATYYNQFVSKMNLNDSLQFTASRTGVLPAGKYRVTVVAGSGGDVRGDVNNMGGGGEIITNEITISYATTINVAVGTKGSDGHYTKGQSGSSSSTMWTYVDYVTPWYDPDVGRYCIPEGEINKPAKPEVYTAPGNGGNTSVYSIVARGGYGANSYTHGTSNGNNYGSGYVTITACNSPPTVPQNVKLENCYSGRSVEMSCDTSIDPENDAIKYIWEGHTDNNPFETIGTTVLPKHSVIVPSAGTTYQVRVRAVDSNGSESGTNISLARQIIYNFPPEISGINEKKENVQKPFTYSFSVDDPDAGDIISVSITLDNEKIGDIQNAVRNKIYYIDLEEHWLYLANGQHFLRVIAKDNKGAQAERTITFDRVCAGLHLELAKPLLPKTNSAIRTVQAIFYYDAPSDATVEVFLTNNANAKTPTWHLYDVSQRGILFEFPDDALQNEEGFSAKIKITKKDIDQKIVFSGATFMLNANGKESEKWADNILFTKAFTGALSGVKNLDELATIVDAAGSGVEINSTQNGYQILIGDLQICYNKVFLTNEVFDEVMKYGYYLDSITKYRAYAYNKVTGATFKLNLSYAAWFKESPVVVSQLGTGDVNGVNKSMIMFIAIGMRQ